MQEILSEKQLEELDWKKGLATAALAGTLAAGSAGAQTWKADSAEWGKSGLPDFVKTNTQIHKTGDQKDFSKEISSVQGPNSHGEYLVTVINKKNGQRNIEKYVTKTPPENLMK